jgi:hypothetical protein
MIRLWAGQLKFNSKQWPGYFSMPPEVVFEDHLIDWTKEKEDYGLTLGQGL